MRRNQGRQKERKELSRTNTKKQINSDIKKETNQRREEEKRKKESSRYYGH
jgi:hypothetical protein